MNALKSVAVIVCVCSIACSIISLIIPLGKMNKIVNMVLGLFLICSLIVPVIGLFDTFSSKISTDESVKSYDQYSQEDYNDLVLQKTADNLVKAANNLLINEGINAKNIKVSIKKDDNNSIYISRINIYISDEYKNRAQDIKKIIGINMSKEPVIYIDEENI